MAYANDIVIDEPVHSVYSDQGLSLFVEIFCIELF